MGYTHSFKVGNITKIWNILQWDIKKIEKYCTEKGIILSHFNNIDPVDADKIKPGIFTDHELIIFNGDLSNKEQDLAHEDFYIEKNGSEFAFCKTNHKPYDLAVCLSILVLKYHCIRNNIDCVIGSDGLEEWNDIIKTFYDIFNYRFTLENLQTIENELLKSFMIDYQEQYKNSDERLTKVFAVPVPVIQSKAFLMQPKATTKAMISFLKPIKPDETKIDLNQEVTIIEQDTRELRGSQCHELYAAGLTDKVLKIVFPAGSFEAEGDSINCKLNDLDFKIRVSGRYKITVQDFWSIEKDLKNEAPLRSFKTKLTNLFNDYKAEKEKRDAFKNPQETIKGKLETFSNLINEDKTNLKGYNLGYDVSFHNETITFYIQATYNDNYKSNTAKFSSDLDFKFSKYLELCSDNRLHYLDTESLNSYQDKLNQMIEINKIITWVQETITALNN